MTLQAVAVAISLIGLAGTVLPGLPGTLLIFAAALGYAWATDFVHIGSRTLWALGVLAALAQLSDVVFGAVSTRLAGASRHATIGAVLGALVGIALLGPVGLLAGPFLGGFTAEVLVGKGFGLAGRAGVAAGAGALLGLGVKVALGLLMIVLFWTSLL